MKRVTCRRGGSRPDEQFHRAYQGDSSTLRIARNDVVGWLTDRGFAEELRDRAALVLSELATNAVQASPGTAYDVRARQVSDRSAIVSVASHTEYEQPPPREHWGPLAKLAPRGRGLMIVDELADEVEVELRNRDTVVVTATFRSVSPA